MVEFQSPAQVGRDTCAGSLADNMALFDDNSDPVQIEEAAATAALYDDILAMPWDTGTWGRHCRKGRSSASCYRMPSIADPACC